MPPLPIPRTLVLCLAATSLLGVLAAVRMSIAYAALGHAIPFADALLSGLADWWLWLPVLPAMFALERRFPLSRTRPLPPIAVHASCAVMCSFAQLAAFAAWSTWIRTIRFGGDAFVDELRTGFAAKFSGGVLVYAAFVAGRHALRAARRSAALETRVTDARLAALEARVQPHFLFNTLNTIAHLVRRDPLGAERAVVDLGELLRAALRGEGRREVTVGDEFALLERYLRIQRARFGDRLRVTTEFAPETIDLMLPPLLLQPLVENAIHHGIGERPQGGSLRVSALLRGERLELAVLDDGDASGKASIGSGFGSGLSSLRERLELLYGDAQRVETQAQPTGGTSVRIALPLRRRAVAS